jgi:hypothetical protein
MMMWMMGAEFIIVQIQIVKIHAMRGSNIMDSLFKNISEVKDEIKYLCYGYLTDCNLYSFICRFDNERNTLQYREDTRRINLGRKEIYIIKETIKREVLQ